MTLPSTTHTHTITHVFSDKMLVADYMSLQEVVISDYTGWSSGGKLFLLHMAITNVLGEPWLHF